MSGPKTSRYKLTPAQRRMLIAQRERQRRCGEASAFLASIRAKLCRLKQFPADELERAEILMQRTGEHVYSEKRDELCQRVQEVIEKIDEVKGSEDPALLERTLEQAKQELATERDKYLRMLAEYDNFRRRTAKEKEGIYTDACADAVRELLPIVDTLERAVADIPPEKQDDPVAKGVRMTLKAAADALRKLDVTEVETVKFDPNLHNAVMHVEDDTKGEGEIVDVFQKGYRRGDKVIRFAMVRVAN